MKKGIDVSTLQGDIDWSRVETDFVMLKASQGRGETKATEGLRAFTDTRFQRNADSAQIRGIPFGCYHYLTAVDRAEAIYEADYFCEVIGSKKQVMELWAAVDVESRYLDGLSKAELGEVVGTFIERVEQHGFRPMLYTNPNFIKYRFGELPKVDIWLAHWNVSEPMKLERLKIWQYGLGNAEGVGKCDLNIGYFELEAASGYSVGGMYTIKRGDVYSNGRAIPKRLVGKSFTIKLVREDKLLLGEINSWVRIK